MQSIPASQADADKVVIPWAHGALIYNGYLYVAIGYNAERICGDNILIPFLPKDTLAIYGGSITDSDVQYALRKSGCEIYFGDENGKIETPAYRIRDHEINLEDVRENKDITRRVWFTDPDNPGGPELLYIGFTLPRKGMVMYAKVGEIAFQCDARSSSDSGTQSVIYDTISLTASGNISEELIKSLANKTVNYQWRTAEFSGTKPASPDSHTYYTDTDTNKTYLYKSGEWQEVSADSNNYSYVIKRVFAENGTYKMDVKNPHPFIPNGDIGTLTQNKIWIGEYSPETQEIEHPVEVCDYVAGEHQIVEMGAYICIFPEAYQVNTAKKDENGRYTEIENLNEETMTPAGVVWRMCNYNGTFFDDAVTSKSAPSSPTDGQLWIDTSDYPCKTKIWSADTLVWNEFQPYIRVWGATSTFPTNWKENDAAEILAQGRRLYDNDTVQAAKNQKYFVIAKTGKCDSEGADSSQGAYSYLQFACAMNTAQKWGGGVNIFTFKRSIPKMDFVVECNNRLWGCRFGQNDDGEIVNEKFASKLGDAKNWHYFSNTSIDSYYVSLGDDGPFTGAITYQNSPIFFREECIHRIYGQYPSNFQLSTLRCSGVKKGSNKSLSILNEVLYYHSPIGFFAYSGGVPVKISDNLGNVVYHDAVSGSLGNEYHVSVKDEQNNVSLLCFNDYYQMWHKEDNLNVTNFISYIDDIYALTAEHELVSIEGRSGEKERGFKWFLQSGNIGYIMPNRKRILKIILRIHLDMSTNADISIMYDSSGNWEHLSLIRPLGKVASVPVSVMPRRCDHFSIKIEGFGDFKLLNLTKIYKGASIYD